MGASRSTLHFSLPEEFHDLLKQAAVVKSYTAGEKLFRREDAVQGAYLVESGRVALWVSEASEVPPRIVGAGTLLGLPSTIGSRPYSLTAEAVEPVEAGFIAQSDFLDLVVRYPSLCLALVRGLAWEITEARHQVSQLLEENRDRAIGRSA